MNVLCFLVHLLCNKTIEPCDNKFTRELCNPFESYKPKALTFECGLAWFILVHSATKTTKTRSIWFNNNLYVKISSKNDLFLHMGFKTFGWHKCSTSSERLKGKLIYSLSRPFTQVDTSKTVRQKTEEMFISIYIHHETANHWIKVGTLEYQLIHY